MNELTPDAAIEKYLSKSLIMQLATSSDGQPWACSLHFIADKNSNLYWISKVTRRHSEDIASNPNVAIAIAIKTDKPLIGIQAEGTANLVDDPNELQTIMTMYMNRHGSDKAFINQIIVGTNEHKLYKFTPKRFSLFDQVEFAEQPSQEWVL